MSDDLDNDLVVLIWGLVSWYYHLSCGQVLQLIHLGVEWSKSSERQQIKCAQTDEGNSLVGCFA